MIGLFKSENNKVLILCVAAMCFKSFLIYTFLISPIFVSLETKQRNWVFILGFPTPGFDCIPQLTCFSVSFITYKLLVRSKGLIWFGLDFFSLQKPFTRAMSISIRR